MIIELTPDEQQNIKFEFIGTRSLTSDYIAECKEFWSDRVEEGRKVGKEFWDGTLYTFEGMGQTDMANPVIQLGEMKYSERIFKKKYGYEGMVGRFGENHWLTHCEVSCSLMTTDGKFAVGIKNMTTNLKGSLYTHIGGNLNKDEMEIKEFSDIHEYIKLEIEEEARVKVDMARLSFNRILLYKSYFTFDYIYQLDVHSRDIDVLNNDDVEMKKFVAMSLDEVLALPEEKVIPDFEYSKWYLGRHL